MPAAIAEEALQGTLEEFPLSKLLIMLASRNRTGVLSVEGGGDLWFSEGRLYLVSTPKGVGVRKILYGADVGTPVEIEAMFEQAKVKGSVLDQIVAVRPEREALLRRLFYEHTINALFELFAISGATFRFEPNRFHALGDRCSQDTATMVSQAEQRLEIWRRIAARIPSTSAVLGLSRQLPNQSHERLITAEEWRYLALLDGHRTVAQVIAESGESAFRVCSSLYRLMVEQLVIRVEAPVSR